MGTKWDKNIEVRQEWEQNGNKNAKVGQEWEQSTNKAANKNSQSGTRIGKVGPK